MATGALTIPCALPFKLQGPAHITQKNDAAGPHKRFFDRLRRLETTLLDASRFTPQFAEIIDLGSSDTAAGDHFDLVDDG